MYMCNMPVKDDGSQLLIASDPNMKYKFNRISLACEKYTSLNTHLTVWEDRIYIDAVRDNHHYLIMLKKNSKNNLRGMDDLVHL